MVLRGRNICGEFPLTYLPIPFSLDSFCALNTNGEMQKECIKAKSKIWNSLCCSSHFQLVLRGRNSTYTLSQALLSHSITATLSSRAKNKTNLRTWALGSALPSAGITKDRVSSLAEAWQKRGSPISPPSIY